MESYAKHQIVTSGLHTPTQYAYECTCIYTDTCIPPPPHTASELSKCKIFLSLFSKQSNINYVQSICIVVGLVVTLEILKYSGKCVGYMQIWHYIREGFGIY